MFHTNLLIVVLSSFKIIHDIDTVAQLLAQSIQELVGVSAARWPGEGEKFPAVGQRAGGLIGRQRGGRGAVQTNVRIRLHTARRRNSLLVSLKLGARKGFGPRQRET